MMDVEELSMPALRDLEPGLRDAAKEAPDNSTRVAEWRRVAYRLPLGERQKIAANIMLSRVPMDSELHRDAVTLIEPTYADLRVQCG